jgi:hypothetical protein
LPLLIAIALVHCSSAKDGVDGAVATDAAAEATLADGADGAPEPNAPPTEGSGARFRVTGTDLVFADGTKLREASHSFFDTKLNTLCDVTEVANNEFVCLSNERVDVFGAETFADSNCTQQVLVVHLVRPPTEPQNVKFVRWGSPCAAKIGRVGPVSNAQTYVKDPVTQECRAFASGEPVMPIPTEMSFTEFGVFTRGPDATPFPGERSGARLVVRATRDTGPDGSFQAGAPRIVDLARGAAGTFAFGVDKKQYLFTSSGVVSGAFPFADATCTVQTLAIEKDPQVCHDDPERPLDGTETHLSSDETCEATQAFTRPAGAPLSVLYNYEKGACRAMPAESRDVALDFYPPQPLVEVPLASLVELTETHVPTNANAVSGTMLEVRASVHSSKDGLELRARSGTPYVRSYDLPCSPAFGGDVVERCIPDVPAAYFDYDVYVDAACTKPGFIYYSTCGPAVPFVTYSDGQLHVAKLLPAPTVAAVYFKAADGVCMRWSNTPNAPVAQAHPLEAIEQIPLSEFPALVSRTRFVE